LTRSFTEHELDIQDSDGSFDEFIARSTGTISQLVGEATASTQ